jgi:hypothetical protein
VISFQNKYQLLTKAKEVSRQTTFTQVVVRQIQHLKGWKGTKTTGQAVQTIHPSPETNSQAKLKWQFVICP